jgi:hypothetical protein
MTGISMKFLVLNDQYLQLLHLLLYNGNWLWHLCTVEKESKSSCVMEVNRKSFHAVKKGYIVRPFLGKCRN